VASLGVDELASSSLLPNRSLRLICEPHEAAAKIVANLSANTFILRWLLLALATRLQMLKMPSHSVLLVLLLVEGASGWQGRVDEDQFDTCQRHSALGELRMQVCGNER